jgi:hypothetical protein
VGKYESSERAFHDAEMARVCDRRRWLSEAHLGFGVSGRDGLVDEREETKGEKATHKTE